MKMFNNKIQLTAILSGLLLTLSCSDELDRLPLDKTRVTPETVYADTAAYQQALAKVYACLAVTGQEGPAGKPDIVGIDEGFSSYLRLYWNLQELPTDLALIGWNDQTISDFHDQDWTATDVFINAMYNRIYYLIQVANEYIRQTTDSKLSDRGVGAELKARISYFRAETRFLRAYSYWHALDFFGGNVPFTTDNNLLGTIPSQTNASELFHYIESELLEIQDQLKEPMQNEYGRVDQAAAWMLLAKLYLNAEVYIKEDRYTDCLTYLNKIIASGYTLEPEYRNLFLRDNNEASGIIFAISFDGNNTQTWGGTTYLVHGPVGGTMNTAEFGIKSGSGWGGFRTTKAFVEKFYFNGTEIIDTNDSRAQFYTDGQTLEIDDIHEFTQGYAMEKFRNVDKEGVAGPNGDYVDTDFPVFRIADAYLMYAEAVLRGGTGGDAATALTYINAIRERAYGDASGNITADELNLDFILDERARELYWEGQRRTDLIRFGRFSTSTYVWPWKGGVKDGISVDKKFDIYPIPSADVNANPNLVQNEGY
jgi:starch-binding outer membrane protein, SusD/RagB family